MRWTFIGKVMSLLFNMLCRLVITFLPRSKHLLISWLQSPFTVILEPKKMQYSTINVFPLPYDFLSTVSSFIVRNNIAICNTYSMQNIC